MQTLFGIVVFTGKVTRTKYMETIRERTNSHFLTTCFILHLFPFVVHCLRKFTYTNRRHLKNNIKSCIIVLKDFFAQNYITNLAVSFLKFCISLNYMNAQLITSTSYLFFKLQSQSGLLNCLLVVNLFQFYASNYYLQSFSPMFVFKSPLSAITSSDLQRLYEKRHVCFYL